jgi:preprotein translocase subunit SecD
MSKTIFLLCLLVGACAPSAAQRAYIIKLKRPGPQALENLSRALSGRLQAAGNFRLQALGADRLRLIVPASCSWEREQLQRLLQPSRLAFARVDEKAEFLQALHNRLPDDGSVMLGCESSPTPAGGQHNTCFLLSNSRSKLEQFLSGIEPPPGRKLAVLPGEWGALAYLLEDPPALELPEVEHAAVLPQPDGRPAVLIAMPAAEREVFARLTGELVGHSLAIVVDGEIRTLSKVTVPVDTGLALIGSSPLVPPAAAERQAQSLAAALMAWKLAGGISLEP